MQPPDGNTRIPSGSVRQRASRFDSGRAIRPVPGLTKNPSPTQSWGSNYPFFSTPSQSPGPYSPTVSTALNSPVKRKPLPPSATHLYSKSRSSSQSTITLQRSSGTSLYPPRSSSLTGISPLSPKNRSFTLSTPGRGQLEVELIPRDLDKFPHGNTPPASVILPANYKNLSTDTLVASERASTTRSIIYKSSNKNDIRNEPQSGLRHEAQLPESPPQKKKNPKELVLPLKPESKMAIPAQQPPPRIPLHIDITRVDDGAYVANNRSQPRSPGVVLQSFFGWKSKTDDDASSTSSPAVSPGHPQNQSPGPQGTYLRHAKPMPSTLDIPRANAAALGVYGMLPNVLPTPPASSSQVADLEQELQEISAELANSIRREMDLEDEVDRLKILVSEQPIDDLARRTSDYFSDTGTASSRYTEPELRPEDLKEIKRKSELEKAQIKLEMSEKMAEVLKQRRLAEDRIHLLEEHVQTQHRAISPISANDRVRYLESLLRDADRRLLEEKGSRDNMEELIGGMRHEIKEYREERDNFRDEVVPQLEAKLASLEMFLSDGQVYSVIDRNVEPIEEDGVSSLAHIKAGLSRSRSVVNRRAGPNRSRSNSAISPTVTRSRANSIKDYSMESREQLIERVRDTEGQRDALHKALKSLLERHRWQEKEFAKRSRTTEQKRDRVTMLTPRRTAFHREVKNLREEILTLRKRADDAMEQKWHCEKGLSGLKIDMDRAQQETSSLRRLLEEHDISVPFSTNQSLGGESGLTKAYNELRTTHALSMVHLKDIGSPQFGPSEDSDVVLALLKQSISDAEAERDAAQQQAEKYRHQARQLQKSELQHLGKEQDLAAELFASASRMDELAAQVRAQINANSQLRSRLAEAVERGEHEQKTSTARIAEMQGKLKGLEDKLLVAQQASEDAMSGHEEDVKLLESNKRRQLRRSRITKPTNSQSSSTASPFFSPLSASSPHSLFAVKSPRLGTTTSTGSAGMSISQATGTLQLETRVQELERALAEAETEMRQVIGKMNNAQMEVAELQGERDEATARSRRLQGEMLREREMVQALMARA